jgi:DNA replication protein DnaC
MKNTLKTMLKTLRLSGLASCLEVRLQEAAGNRLSHEEFLELLVQDEVNIRHQRLLERRVRAAGFRELTTLEDFDWSFNPSIKRDQIYPLATGQFIQKATDVLFLGPPGTGKSFLSQALGYQAIRQGSVVLYRSIFDMVRELGSEETMARQTRIMTRYLKPDLLIIDDFGIKSLSKESGEYFVEVILRRHQTKSTIMTSNRPIEDWGKLIGDVPAATAVLDRFLQQARIISITGRSYRLKNQACQEEN